jgi:predicted RNA-binding Zn-ribbon protein involved in translation (DUF1610 family)
LFYKKFLAIMNLCHVCDKRIHRHKHFGAQACSPCGAFFRRTIAERKTYQCRKENECEIKFGILNKFYAQLC